MIPHDRYASGHRASLFLFISSSRSLTVLRKDSAFTNKVFTTTSKGSRSRLIMPLLQVADSFCGRKTPVGLEKGQQLHLCSTFLILFLIRCIKLCVFSLPQRHKKSQKNGVETERKSSELFCVSGFNMFHPSTSSETSSHSFRETKNKTSA